MAAGWTTEETGALVSRSCSVLSSRSSLFLEALLALPRIAWVLRNRRQAIHSRRNETGEEPGALVSRSCSVLSSRSSLFLEALLALPRIAWVLRNHRQVIHSRRKETGEEPGALVSRSCSVLSSRSSLFLEALLHVALPRIAWVLRNHRQAIHSRRKATSSPGLAISL